MPRELPGHVGRLVVEHVEAYGQPCGQVDIDGQSYISAAIGRHGKFLGQVAGRYLLTIKAYRQLPAFYRQGDGVRVANAQTGQYGEREIIL